MRDNNLDLHKRSPSFYMIIFLFLYVLFALSGMRRLFALNIEGLKGTNEIWLILFISLISFIYNKKNRSHEKLNKYNKYLGICLILLCIIVAIGAFNAVSMSQFIYASLLFIAPILLFFVSNKMTEEEAKLLFKVFVVTCLVYSILSITLSTNYSFFRELMGNPIKPTEPAYVYRNSRYRSPMMMGTSITVSYYFNITLPLCFHMLYYDEEKKWRIISALTIGTNIFATLLLSSRSAVFAMMLVIIYSILFISDKKSFKKTFVIIILLIGFGIFAFNKYNLSRLLMGLDFSSASDSSRLTAAKLGSYIFSLYPIFGSGMGRFYHRVYADRFITVDGVSGLIDPHNMYILILSELGAIGLILCGVAFIVLFKGFLYIKEKPLRQTAYLIIFTSLICGIGGSNLIISISYSTIFWIYVGTFNALSTPN